MKVLVALILLTSLSYAAPAPRLIKQTNLPEVYLILDGKKSWIPDPAAYNRIIVTSENKITLISDVDVYVTGPQIDTNSQLIRGKDANEIYLVSYGQKRWITNPNVFNDLGFDWNKVVVVDHWVLQLFSSGPAID
jgi:hypothetical protein